MKYELTNKTSHSCTIRLIPENAIEEKLLKQKDQEDTFMFHYMAALAEISKDATFISLLDQSDYPSKVTVKYQITKGIGM
ncbi:MAG: hypothetical protein JST13_08555 [Bacteroidetes bacterium]|nr:hypothetical protein [Bacteroidota bacterium]